MSLDEKQHAALVLPPIRPHPMRQHSRPEKVLSTIEDVESIHTLTPELTPVPTFEREASPLSPFYDHDEMKCESKDNINPFESDLEACLTKPKVNPLMRTKTNECTVWPGQDALKARHREAKLRRGCNPMRKLDKKTRVWIKILICLVIIGVAIGLGLGISKATGASFWKAGISPV